MDIDATPDLKGAPESAGRLAGVRLPLQVLAICAVTVMLRYTSAVLLPVVISVLLFYALDPIVDQFQRWRCPRLLASFIVVMWLAGGVVITGYMLWPQFSDALQRVPASAEKLRQTFRQQKRQSSGGIVQRMRAAATAIDSAAAEVSSAPAQSPGVVRVEVQQPWRVSDMLVNGSVSVISRIGQAITILFLTVFLLNEDDSFKRKLVAQMHSLGSKRVTVKILNDIAGQMKRFIWVQALTSGLVAVITALALYWLEVRQPIIWGLFAGIMNIIPFFGPLIVSTVLAAIAFLQFGTISQAVIVAAVTMAITSFEGMFLTPHLMSRAASLNHVAIFLALAFWSWAWGVPGMLLAVPMLMAIKAVCDHVDGLQPFGEFLGK